MMLYPSIVDLLEKTGSKYSLVIAASKRAREISESDTSEEPLDGARGITKAAEEIADGTVSVINYEGKDAIIEKLAHVNTEEYAENVMHIQMADLGDDEEQADTDEQSEDAYEAN